MLSCASVGRRAFDASSLLAACGGDDGKAQQTTTPEGSIKKGGRFSMARRRGTLSLDPIVPSDNGSIWVIYQMFDQLTTVNEDSSGVARRSRKAGRSPTTGPSTRSPFGKA